MSLITALFRPSPQAAPHAATQPAPQPAAPQNQTADEEVAAAQPSARPAPAEDDAPAAQQKPTDTAQIAGPVAAPVAAAATSVALPAKAAPAPAARPLTPIPAFTAAPVTTVQSGPGYRVELSAAEDSDVTEAQARRYAEAAQRSVGVTLILDRLNSAPTQTLLDVAQTERAEGNPLATAPDVASLYKRTA